MDRRATLKWVLAASAVGSLLRREARAVSPPTARGYGSDPALMANYPAGEPWPTLMTAAQRRLATVLSDLILPADEHSPSASAAGVVDFIDQWVSAPYAEFQRDRGIVLGGFAWLDAEAGRRFGQDFIELEPAAQCALCDDICDSARAAEALREAAQFFALYRDLTAGGFYSSPSGRQDLNYMGNVPLTRFDGPPPALLESLGLGAVDHV